MASACMGWLVALGPRPDALTDALTDVLDSGFHCVRMHWIRGFMGFQPVRRTRSVMLMVSE